MISLRPHPPTPSGEREARARWGGEGGGMGEQTPATFPEQPLRDGPTAAPAAVAGATPPHPASAYRRRCATRLCLFVRRVPARSSSPPYRSTVAGRAPPFRPSPARSRRICMRCPSPPHPAPPPFPLRPPIGCGCHPDRSRPGPWVGHPPRGVRRHSAPSVVLAGERRSRRGGTGKKGPPRRSPRTHLPPPPGS